MIVGLPDVYEDIHRAAANHSLFAGFIGGQREMMQGGFAAAHCFARFSPNFSFNTAAAHGARGFPVLQEEHLRSASLGSRSARVSDRGYNYSLTAAVCLLNQIVKFVLSDGSHDVAQTLVCGDSLLVNTD